VVKFILNQSLFSDLVQSQDPSSSLPSLVEDCFLLLKDQFAGFFSLLRALLALSQQPDASKPCASPPPPQLAPLCTHVAPAPPRFFTPTPALPVKFSLTTVKDLQTCLQQLKRRQLSVTKSLNSLVVSSALRRQRAASLGVTRKAR
jgi:hypothetical protein